MVCYKRFARASEFSIQPCLTILRFHCFSTMLHAMYSFLHDLTIVLECIALSQFHFQNMYV